MQFISMQWHHRAHRNYFLGMKCREARLLRGDASGFFARITTSCKYHPSLYEECRTPITRYFDLEGKILTSELSYTYIYPLG